MIKISGNVNILDRILTKNEKLHVDKQTNNSPNILVGKRPFPLTSAAIMIQHVGMFCGACANPAAN